ncbi:MAG: retroviral-like aspartic protease [Bacteroidetes bacterium]|nr:retroviral-like aspartic protease [Bacteroidota bacterium]
MRVPYSIFPQKFLGKVSTIFTPYLDIKLINGIKEFQTKALVDSGSYITMINSYIAEKFLGLDWDKGVLSSTQGIVGSSQAVYIHKVELEIVKFENSRKTIEVGVVNTSNFNILLGQIGFFENFTVAFCYSKKYFYVNPS